MVYSESKWKRPMPVHVFKGKAFMGEKTPISLTVDGG
jgi:hypothetical protein